MGLAHPQGRCVAGRSAPTSSLAGFLGCCLALLFAPASAARAETQLSLAAAIAVAKAHRSEVKESAISVRLAKVGITVAAMRWFQLNVGGQYAENATALNVNAPDYLCAELRGECTTPWHSRQLTATANLTVPIWSGMSNEANLAQAVDTKRAAQEQVEASALTVALDAGTSYWAVRRAELLLEVSERQRERDEEIAGVTKARVGAGIAPALDYTRARSRLLQRAAAITGVAGQIEQARATLAGALQIDDAIVLTEDPLTRRAATRPIERLLSDALARRPELRVAGFQIDAQRQQIRQDKGQYWPQLSAVGSAQLQNQAFGIPTSNVIGNFTAGLQVSITIFSSLSTFNAVRSDDLTLGNLVEVRNRTEVLVRTQVLSAYAGVKSSTEQHEELVQALDVSRAGIALVRRRYEAGTALLIEVLQAEDDLQTVEVGLVNSAVDRAVAELNLAAAIGEL